MTYLKDLFGSKLINTLFIAIIALIFGNLILSKVNHLLDKSDKVNKTVLGFIKPLTKFLVYFLVCMFVANSLGIDTSSIVALISVFTAAFALAAQNVLGNLFGGLTLLLVHPFQVGDYVNAAGSEGIVKSIGMFYTVLNTTDNKVITVPNGAVSGATITNFSVGGDRRVDIVVTASYESNIDDVKAALNDAIKNTKNVLDKNQSVCLTNYLSSSIEYSVRVWSEGANYWQVRFDLLENIKRSFDKYGVQMTYDHIIVHNA